MSLVEKLFAVIFTISGLTFVFIVPPFQNPDEHMHFYRSYQLSKGQLFSSSEDGGKLYGGEIPLSMREMAIKSDLERNFDFGYRFDVNYQELLQYHYGGQKVFEGFPNTAIYTPLSYIPSILAHWVTAFFNGPLLVAFYLGRLLSFLFALVAILFTIRLIPFGKWVIFVIGLLPMTVASAVSVSADAMTLSLSMIFIAATLYVSFGKREVSKKWLTILFFLAIGVALVKQAHVALLPILFLVPLFNKNYRIKKVYWCLGATFLTAAFLFFIWYRKTDQITVNFSPLIEPTLQKTFVLLQPWSFVGALLQTYLTNYGNGFVIGMFGNFGWLTAQLPTLYIIISTLVLYWATRIKGTDGTTLKLLSRGDRRRFNFFSISVFLIVVAFISAALYVYWTPYKHPFIMGIQGRYFLPILPLLLLPFIRYSDKDQRRMQNLVVFGSIVVLAGAIYTTVARFYLPVLG